MSSNTDDLVAKVIAALARAEKKPPTTNSIINVHKKNTDMTKLLIKSNDSTIAVSKNAQGAFAAAGNYDKVAIQKLIANNPKAETDKIVDLYKLAVVERTNMVCDMAMKTPRKLKASPPALPSGVKIEEVIV